MLYKKLADLRDAAKSNDNGNTQYKQGDINEI